MALPLTPPLLRASARPRPRRLLPPVATVAGLGAATLALALRDPHQQGSWGECPSAQLGFWCPGCGGLRAVNDLTHLHVAAAVSSNVVFLAVLPVAIFFLARWLVDSWRGVRRSAPEVRRWHVAVLVGVLVAFTVLRNLAPFGWLAP